MSNAERELREDLDRMKDMFENVMNLSRRIGGLTDGIGVRDDLQDAVKRLVGLSQKVKTGISSLRDAGEDLGDIEAVFSQISRRMQQNLPGVIDSLKSAGGSPDAGGYQRDSLQQPLLDQTQLDADQERLEILQTEVTDILAALREVNLLFTHVYGEIQKQRHMVTTIDRYTSDAVDDMIEGNEQLEKAGKHQKAGTKCLCWIFVIVGVVAAGLAIFVGVFLAKKKK
jgi:methyl-accepting chemotaxis protein